MIYYFSGTGNSRWVAQRLAALLKDDVTDMGRAAGGTHEVRPREGEAVGFVMPAHGWDVPRAVHRFMEGLRWEGGEYVYLVATCGDDTGCLRQRFERLLAQKGMGLDSAWAVQMPNTYVGLPGFDVDSSEVVAAKLQGAPATVERIAKAVAECRRGEWDVRPGLLPRTKTYVLGTAFRHWMMSPKPFRATQDCVGCGRCVRVCPMGNVSLAEGRPCWGSDCTMCLACYHHCPSHAVRYGRMGQGKGQYVHPSGKNGDGD